MDEVRNRLVKMLWEYDIKQAASDLGLSRQRLYAWRKSAPGAGHGIDKMVAEYLGYEIVNPPRRLRKRKGK